MGKGYGYGFERLWEGLIGLKMCGDELLYGLDIESVLKRVRVGLADTCTFGMI